MEEISPTGVADGFFKVHGVPSGELSSAEVYFPATVDGPDPMKVSVVASMLASMMYALHR
jgi:hypothetical protein